MKKSTFFEELPARKNPVHQPGSPNSAAEGPKGTDPKGGTGEEASAKRIRQAVYDIRYRSRREEIELEAEAFALEELEDHDYKVIVDYLMSLVEGVDEDSIVVSIEKTDVKVTKLGLGEDEDKSARVTFELKVKYKLEEGVVQQYKKNIVVIYDVVFEEGEFGDEDVELISIV